MTSYTVTITDTTNGVSGWGLQVLCVTGVTESGGASATAGNNSSGTPGIAVTPGGSGSFLVFAVENAAGGSPPAFTPATSCTFDMNFQDTTSGTVYGAGHYTGTVTSGTPVTVGATNTCIYEIAAYELPASGTPALDASTPASTQNTGTTLASAAFTPPTSGCVLVALVANNFSGVGGLAGLAVSSSPSLTWTKRAVPAGTSLDGDVAVYTATVAPVSPVISTTSLPPAQVGVAYSATLAATGGTAPYTWSIVSGSLPSWASLNSSTGAITGTPSSLGTAVFTVQVSDNASLTATQSLTLDMLVNGKLGTAAVPGQAQPGNFIPGQVSVAVTAVNVSAGLASGTGAAGGISKASNSGLATGTGSAQQPTIPRITGLSTGTAAALAPSIPRAIGLATGSGTAGGISQAANAGLATGTGTALAPGIGLTAGLAGASGTTGGISVVVNAGLATGTCAALAPAVGLTPGLASGTGAANAPNTGLTPGLATGVGQAFAPSVPRSAGLATGTGTASGISQAVNAGLATGAGTAFNITVQAPGVSAGLATATGTAGGISVVVNAGLASGTGTALAPAVALTPALASAASAAFAPVIPRSVSLATGTGSAFSPSAPFTIGLATAAGSAFAPSAPRLTGLAAGTGAALAPSIPRAAGLATGTGSASGISQAVNAGLAAAAGAALVPALDLGGRKNVDYTGSTLSVPNTLGGTITVAVLSGTLSVAANTLTGTAAVNANTLGGTLSLFAPGGTLAVTSDTHAGTLSVVVNSFSGTTVEDKMQEVDIILNEFNDATVTFQILNNASPMNITGMTVNALFKKTRGDLDSAGTTKTYSSGGGSPAITIVTPTTGSCTLAIPDADVIFPNFTFYRIDVVNGTVQTTAIFGTVTITQL